MLEPIHIIAVIAVVSMMVDTIWVVMTIMKKEEPKLQTAGTTGCKHFTIMGSDTAKVAAGLHELAEMTRYDVEGLGFVERPEELK